MEAEMTKYLIVNRGCDDETYTELYLFENELETLIRFARENNKTGGGCKPVISIYEEYEKDDNGYFHTGKWVDKEFVDFKDLVEVEE